ncbi:LLM class flavin-dependent oxidoreductase [Ketogulonicigenium vulgare]|uniref:Luciferase-like monooxygenase n=1 Tax=Ketogulonicigenium vulgare (strain WSH-001) TaxID=759362 RepID=F9Y3B6_KETVW|nr:LLM class flavin-dependent oxidoreductase [Ketogulonicigenium vulgare]ADO42153.1 Luciferase-like monooxygenase superfamily [Ketogulonicigenium vulgare Y25]AEM40357.1 Luciferase-like protein monooxygenase superfamily protein [Ketogulonicigenium vulgare WSH-001]ALJ80547.1 alkane 1-monooxygenase [Ketogulonicigenium vulgare]ANW33369.1 alkane 1-monooxygenase [Ketogulonicigenium vulgare]AOZ54070.1 Luciferase-like monooxygenase superfamily [Ketogulonicigenium vulgare]
MQHYSILDLCQVTEGSTPSQALANSATLAQLAEANGYHRFWLAEHHNMPGVASAATAVVIGHVGAATKTIRLGAGGIMLPNHSPLVIAEQFGTLAQLFPGRVDLGLGRAPGTDQVTAHALRRNMSADDTFPQDVVDLMTYFSDDAGQLRVQAVPAAGTNVPVWVLGSSLYGAQLAAYLGLPYAFASHFAPDHLAQAVDVYRRTFRPSEHLEKPYFMMAMGLYAAESDAEAEFLKTSQVQTFARLRTGMPGLLPPPRNDIATLYPPSILQGADHALSVSAVGGRDKLRADIGRLIDAFAPDEIMAAGAVYDFEARKRSLEIGAEVMRDFI